MLSNTKKDKLTKQEESINRRIKAIADDLNKLGHKKLTKKQKEDLTNKLLVIVKDIVGKKMSFKEVEETNIHDVNLDHARKAQFKAVRHVLDTIKLMETQEGMKPISSNL